MAERILLIGYAGMLGRAWVRMLQAKGLDFTAVDYPELDLRAPKTIRAQVNGAYRLVINCAAYTDVDGAELDAERARMINGFGVGELAAACRDTGAVLVHYSTDYVFDGQADRPYGVDAPRRPINAYGQSKALGEELVERAGGEYLLIRTSWLYAPWGRNFVRTIAAAAKERPVLKVVNDQRGRPTSAEHLATMSWRLLEKGVRGIWHVCDGGECTWYEFAKEIVGRVNPACRVEPCTSQEYRRLARRPAYSVLDLSRTEALLGSMPVWRENLADVLRRLEE